MSVKLISGKVKTVWLPVTTSTALVRDTIVEITSGLVAGADDNDTALAGVIAKTIASTDSDYATARSVPVVVPAERHVIWEIDVTSGDTAVAGTHEGTEVGIDSSGTVDLDDVTNKVFLITRVVSASKVQGYLKINGAY